MNVCEICQRSNSKTRYSKTFEKVLCDSCYLMCKRHPVVYIPPEGEIHYDDEGNILCHVCGRGFKKLAEHIKHKHKMTTDEYREEFGLNRTASLIGKNFIGNVPTEDFIIKYCHNRFKKGHSYNKNKSKRLQAIKSRIGMKYNKKSDKQEKDNNNESVTNKR